MSRRSSDKAQGRLVLALLALNVALAILAAAVSFRAMLAINGFDAFIEAASAIRKEKSLLPEGY